MAQTLYRKYRPQQFDQIVGQNHIKITLQNQVASGEVAHAYIFAGTRGVGKTTTARVLAKAINCGEGKKAKKELAEIGKQIMEGKAIDVIEIDAASNRGIDEIRELREKVKYAPGVLPFKVYIIDEVHMLTTEAFNALLKTLEEPPVHAIFILATTEIHKVPTTIISRCQRFDFKRVNASDLMKRLAWMAEQENKQVDNDVLRNIINNAEGSVRDAESLLGKLLSLGTKKVTQKEASLVLPESDWPYIVNFVTALLNSDATKALELVNQLVDEGGDLKSFSSDVVEFLRKMLLKKVNPKLNQFSVEHDLSVEKQIDTLLSNVEAGRLKAMIEILIEASQSLKYSQIQQLPLELAVVKIIEPESSLSHLRSKDSTISSSEPKPKPHEPIVFKKPSAQTVEATPKPAGESKKIKSLTKKTKVQKSSGQIISLKEVLNQWEAVVAAIKEVNHSLASTLRMHKPSEIHDSRLTIPFKFKFHKERIDDNSNKQALENILSRHFGKDLQIDAVIVEDLEISVPDEKNNAVDTVLQNFGGKVVD